MPFEKTDGMIRHTRLHNESHEYLERREELRRAEVELIWTSLRRERHEECAGRPGKGCVETITLQFTCVVSSA
jgi:hypothetical protein